MYVQVPVAVSILTWNDFLDTWELKSIFVIGIIPSNPGFLAWTKTLIDTLDENLAKKTMAKNDQEARLEVSGRIFSRMNLTME